MVSCSAEWRCPAARAPASARAAIRAAPRSAFTHPGRLPSLRVLWRRALPAPGAGAPSGGRMRICSGGNAQLKSLAAGLRVPRWRVSLPDSASARAAACAVAVVGARARVLSARRKASADPLPGTTKKCASPPGSAGSQPRTVVFAPHWASSAALTALRRKAHARGVIGMRCALMPSAEATSAITAS
eukprot:2688745-Pleurochrysis_carterae.AAC.1